MMPPASDIRRVSGLWGLVLAAGQSSRMRRSKALLVCPDANETFVARTARVLREGGVANVAIVIRPADAPLQREAGQLHPPVSIVENPRSELGQLSSLLAGLDHVEARDADAVVVMPVDMPLVSPASVAAVLRAAAHHPAPIVRVVHEGRPGHPILFRRAVFERLRSVDLAVGARALAQQYAQDVLDVPVDDPGVLRDIDRPEEYRHLFDPSAEL